MPDYLWNRLRLLPRRKSPEGHVHIVALGLVPPPKELDKAFALIVRTEYPRPRFEFFSQCLTSSHQFQIEP